MARFAAIQMCSSSNVEINIAVAERFINEAVGKGAKLVVLPEMFASFGLTHNEKIQVAEPFGQGPIQQFLSHQAKQAGIWLVGGTILLQTTQPDKLAAACLLYNDEGEVVARYDKIHLFCAKLEGGESYNEAESITPGRQIVVASTPFGRLGLAVCYDIRFPNLFCQLAHQQTEVFIVPAAFTQKTGEAHWHLLTRCRAVEHYSYLIGACQGGFNTENRQTYGHSLIVDPWGQIVAECKQLGEQIIYADIDLAYAHSLRRAFNRVSEPVGDQ